MTKKQYQDLLNHNSPMKLLLLLVFITSLSCTSYAQTLNTAYGGNVVDDLFISNSLMKTNKRLKYEQIEGSPYATQNFVESNIVLKNGDIMERVMTRINLYDNQLEIKDGDEIYELRPQYLSKVIYRSGTYEYEDNLDNNLNPGFYKVYHQGEYALYGFSEIEFREEEAATNNYTDSKPDRFVSKAEYYILELANGNVYTSISKKQLLKSLKENDLEVYQMIKDNKLNPTKKEDLMELIVELEAINLED